MASFCTLCGSTDPADLGQVIGICLDATACHQRQYARLRDQRDRFREQARILGESKAEWLCEPCSTIHPWRDGDRFTAACPDCESPMVPTSVSARALEDARSQLEHAKAALAGDSEGVRLWMLDCGELVAKHRARAEAAEAKLASARETVTTFRTHYAATLGDRAADLACAVLQVLDRDEMGSEGGAP